MVQSFLLSQSDVLPTNQFQHLDLGLAVSVKQVNVLPVSLQNYYPKKFVEHYGEQAWPTSF